MVSCPQLRDFLAKALSFESRVGAPSPWHSGFGLIFLRMIEPMVIPSACVGGLDSPAAGGSWDRNLFVAVRGSKRDITGPKRSRHRVQRVA